MLWLTLCPKLSQRSLDTLLRLSGSAVAARERWLRQGGETPDPQRWARARGSQWVTRSQPEFPARLRDLSDVPHALYYVGSLEALQAPSSVAIVGTRTPTPQGHRLAGRFAYHLALNGVAVISGLARGVDSAAHAGSLQCHGNKSVAVVGCGLDRCYPRENWPMFRELARTGLVLSEYPPGTPPEKWHFPARNRIMAALAQLVLVVEAPPRSGSLITVAHAKELGRDIFAVPGPLDHPNYQGNLDLLNDGVALARSPEAVTAAALKQIPPASNGLMERAYRPEEWSERLGLSLPQVLVQLGLWELQKLVVRTPDGCYGLAPGFAGNGDFPKMRGSSGMCSQ